MYININIYNKYNAPGEKGHFLIIIKWTWGVFPKMCKLTPPSFLQLGTEEYVCIIIAG